MRFRHYIATSHVVGNGQYNHHYYLIAPFQDELHVTLTDTNTPAHKPLSGGPAMGAAPSQQFLDLYGPDGLYY
jgi:hypothetical protein